MKKMLIQKMALIGFLMSSVTTHAFQIENGNYDKRGYNENDKVISHSWADSSDNSFGEIDIFSALRIEQIDFNNFVISNSTTSNNHSKFPQAIAINLSTNGIQSINRPGFQALKAKYGKNKFANMIKNISTEVLERSEDKLEFAVHFDLDLNSNFGIVNNIRLTTEMALEKTKCFHIGEKYDSQSGKSVIKKIALDCIKLNSFKNTRLTEFSTNLKSEINKIVAFAADIAIQLMTSAVNIEEILVKEQRRVIK